MKRGALWLLFVLSLFTLALVNGVADLYSLYWLYPWLDVPVHFLGGVTVVLGFCTLRGVRTFLPESMRGFLGAMLCTLIVGILWELFEFYIGAAREFLHVYDTSLDLLMDMLGGLFGYVLQRSLTTLEQ